MFSDIERGIFAYKDGSRDEKGELRTIRADPLEIDQKLLSIIMDQDLEASINTMQQMCTEAFEYEEKVKEALKEGKEPPPPDSPEVTKNKTRLMLDLAARIVPAYREAFSVKPLDSEGNGLNNVEVLNIAKEYNNFKYEVKKNSDVKQNGSPLSAGPQAPPGSPTWPTVGSSGTKGGVRQSSPFRSPED